MRIATLSLSDVDAGVVELKPPHLGDMRPALVDITREVKRLHEEDFAALYIVGDNSPPFSVQANRELAATVACWLGADKPTLAVGSGMFLLNLAFGGGVPPAQTGASGSAELGRKSVYVSPGSKMAAILGAGGFFRLRKQAMSAGLPDSARSPSLLASAYDTESGDVEGLESTEHSWVIGLRARLDREGETPPSFGNFIQAFFERAQSVAVI